MESNLSGELLLAAALWHFFPNIVLKLSEIYPNVILKLSKNYEWWSPICLESSFWQQHCGRYFWELSENYPKIIRKLSENYPKVILKLWMMVKFVWKAHSGSNTFARFFKFCSKWNIFFIVSKRNRISYSYESSFLVKNCINFYLGINLTYLNCTFIDLEGKNDSFRCLFYLFGDIYIIKEHKSKLLFERYHLSVFLCVFLRVFCKKNFLMVAHIKKCQYKKLSHFSKE